MEKALLGLRPEIQSLAHTHLTRCEQRGLVVLVTSGLRTWHEQMAAYRKGRAMTPAGWAVVDHAAIVTNALPDHAPHCRGAAYDVCPLVNEKPAWDRLDLFQAIADCAPEGLVWGGTWTRLKDLPHYELPSWRTLPFMPEAA